MKTTIKGTVFAILVGLMLIPLARPKNDITSLTNQDQQNTSISEAADIQNAKIISKLIAKTNMNEISDIETKKLIQIIQIRNEERQIKMDKIFLKMDELSQKISSKD